jgi:8-oxo-dGTP pyrophosphatase MutT (NUDIX family)
MGNLSSAFCSWSVQPSSKTAGFTLGERARGAAPVKLAKRVQLGHTRAVTFSACKADLERRFAAGPRIPDLARHCSLLAQDHCFSRTKFDPGHFTASSFVLNPEGDALLLILHKKLGLWLQPGGHFEETDASYVAAASRELHEETGLTDVVLLEALFDADIHAIPVHRETKGHQHFDLRVLFQARTTDLRRSDEVAAIGWFPLTSIVKSANDLGGGVGTDTSVVRAVQSILSRASRLAAELPGELFGPGARE